MSLLKQKDIFFCLLGEFFEFKRISANSDNTYDNLKQFYLLHTQEMEKILVKENCKPHIIEARDGYFFLSEGDYYFPDYLVFIPTRLRSLEDDFLIIVPISLSLNDGLHRLKATIIYKELTLDILRDLVKNQIIQHKDLSVTSLCKRIIRDMENHNISLSPDVDRINIIDNIELIEEILNGS